MLPGLTDSDEALDTLLSEIADAGATGESVLALHLRPGTREWFHDWLVRDHPELLERYAALYRRGAYVEPSYRGSSRCCGATASTGWAPHGRPATGAARGRRTTSPGPAARLPAHAEVPEAVVAAQPEQLALM